MDQQICWQWPRDIHPESPLPDVLLFLVRLPGGDALPLQRFPPSSKESVPVSCPAACQPCRLPARPLLRPAKVCQAGDAYTREKFKPQPTRKSANIANKYTVMPRTSLPLLSISCLNLNSGSISELLHVFRLFLQRYFRNGSLREHLL